MGKVLLDSEYALLTYHKENFILALTWKSSCPFEGYTATFNHAVQFALENKVKHFVSDIREEGVVPINNLRWLKEHVISRAYELGVVKVALVINEELFSSIYADLIKKSISESKITTRFFMQPEEAMSWLALSS